MADFVSKLKTATLIAGAAVLVAACGEKAAETNVEVTTEEVPAVEEAMPADDAAMEAAPAEATPVEGATEEAPAAEGAEATEEAPVTE